MAAARRLAKSKKREHIFPILVSLHINFRIDFNILLLTFKARFGHPGTSLVGNRCPQQGFSWQSQSQLRSEAFFSVKAPSLWNNLPKGWGANYYRLNPP